MSYKNILVILALLGLVVTACNPLGRSVGWGQYASNGERIYFTGTSANGRISYSGGDSGGMMGGQLACADCHGSDGRGGQHTMHMTVMDAPDVRWSTLAGTEQEHSDDSAAEEHSDDDDHDMEHAPYDEATFKRVVTEGLNPDGNPLDPAMPRWRMSEQDLADLIAYLKTLN